MIRLALFGPCPVGGCSAFTAIPDMPCGQCLAELTAAGWLRETDNPELPAGGPTVAAEPTAGTSQGWMAQQLCWLCGARRTCRDDPLYPGTGRLICKTCTEQTEGTHARTNDDPV